jgi:hypothetical protein
MSKLWLLGLFLVAFGYSEPLYPEAAAQVPGTAPKTANVAANVQQAPPAGYSPSAGVAKDPTTGAAVSNAPKDIKPYRTFISIQRYNMEQNGEASNPISNVRLEILWPNGNGRKMELPEGGVYWPIGNGQVQEINRTYELPWAAISNDGFKFDIQMLRKGVRFQPCQFDVVQVSQFNRVYVCHTDLNAQTGLSPEQQDKEGIQIRIFTDLNSDKKDIPNDALAVR